MEYQRKDNEWPYARLTAIRLVEMKQAGRNGNGQALFDLAKLHEMGNTLAPRNNSEALRYYMDSSEHGYSSASMVLGHAYHTGDFLDQEQDLLRAWKYFDIAHRQGEDYALNYRGWVERDLEDFYQDSKAAEVRETADTKTKAMVF